MAAWALLVRQVVSAALAAVAVLAGFQTWRPLAVDFATTAPTLVAITVVVMGLGALGRWGRWPGWTLVPVQVGVVGLLVHHEVTGTAWPTTESVSAFGAAIEGAVTSARTYTAPVPLEADSVGPLLLLGGAGVVLVTDLLVGTLRRPATSGLVLLAICAVPVIITGADAAWWTFVVAAAAFLGLLLWQHDERIAAWGRPLGAAGDTFPGPPPRRALTAVGLASASVVVALVAPIVLPDHLGAVRLGGRDGGGGEAGSDVEVVNPMVDLRRDLVRGQDLRLLRITTRAEQPTYVRLAVLNQFVGGRWTPGDRTIPADQVASGEMPALDGVSLTLPRTESDYSVTVWPDFRSTWLPTTAHVSEIEAGTEWRYDVTTRDFIAVDDDTSTAGMDYRFTGVHLDYDSASMDLAPSGASEVPDFYTDVPEAVRPDLTALATDVTADAPTRFQKALALQDWFRHSGGFRYDLTPAASLGDGTADLMAFLDEETGRVGYCEQFAASMAIMARTVGIPSRVAVGFLEPTRVAPRTWEFTAWDMHAWPELYFPGSGWVRFEPTPGARAPQTPDYTNVPLTPPTPTTSPSPTPTRSAQPTPETTAPTDESTPEPATDPDSDASFAWWRAGGVALVLLLVVGLALLPRLVRNRRRSRRAGEGIEGAWQELRDLLTDLGHPWPTGRSPRRTGAVIAEWLSGADAEAALDRIIAALEQHRYARTPGTDAPYDVTADLALVAEALRSGVEAEVARRATWWPRSVVSPSAVSSGIRSRVRDDDASAPPSGP